MLDSNIFDRLLASDGAVDFLNDLTSRGLLVIVTTHVQADELAATREPQRRADLLAVAERLVMTVVPTAGAIWGVSKWGAAKWGDGGGTLRIGDIMKANPEDAEDALIAITAATDADILVTDERDLPKRIKRQSARPEVLNFEQFMERVRRLPFGCH